MLTISSAIKLWYAPEPVDFRLGFDGLNALVRTRLAADPQNARSPQFTTVLMRYREADLPCGVYYVLAF